jgi:hypothetical protein
MDINEIFGNSNKISNNPQLREILNNNDIYVIDGYMIKCMSNRIDDENPYELSIDRKSIIEDNLKKITDRYKKIIYFESEELAYDYESVSYFIDLCMESDVKLFVYSFNCNINDFLKVKYPNKYPTQILANTAATLIQNCNGLPPNLIRTKNKKLLFLNYNRKINRDLIITYFKNWNELHNPENIISYHNNYTFNSNVYKSMYKDYAEKNGIDFNFLDSLVLKPEEVDVHNQGAAQQKAQLLHYESKFNIICEPFFGLSDNPNEYEYYNHTLSRKVVYPILYNNVIFVHEHSPILSKTLKNLGFELFFDNIEDFKNNMTDEFYYSDETQRKLTHNNTLLKKLGLSYEKTLKDEMTNFFN